MEKVIGLDIGSRVTKVVELERVKGERPKLRSLGSAPTPTNALQSDSDLDLDKISHSIKALLDESRIKTRSVVASLPEPRVFTRVIEFPPLKGEELQSALEWELERFIPLPRDKVKVSWMVLERSGDEEGEGEGKMKILLVAAPKSLVNRYLSIVERAGLEPVAFESEILALVRSFFSSEKVGPVSLLISLGAASTDLCIVDGGTIQFTRSISTSGNDLAEAISRELGFDTEQAEEYKQAYGLEEGKLGGKVLKVVKPIFDIVVNEIEESIISYQTKMPMKPVKRVVLTGGTACLPGIVVYLAESLGIEVQIGDPWIDVTIPPEFEEQVRRLENQARYAVAVGLARKSI